MHRHHGEWRVSPLDDPQSNLRELKNAVAHDGSRLAAQERPISEQIRITKMFINRKQKVVEQTRLETEKAKEVLSTDGERRLEALLAKEEVLPSPFTVPQPAITPNVQAEFSRLQGIIDSVQQELAHLQCAERLSHTLPDDDDDDMVADLPHKKTKVGSQTPAVISGCAPRTPLAITGGHGQSPSRLWDPQAIQRNASVIAMNRRTTGQYGLRGVRVGEASHPGPPKLLLRRPGSQHSRGGCYSGGYTRGSRRHR